jgi:hypothetical protein
MEKEMIKGGRPHSPIYNNLPEPCIPNVYTNYTKDHLAHVKSIRQDVRTVNAMGSIPKDVSARHSHSNGESPQACVTWTTSALRRCCQ